MKEVSKRPMLVDPSTSNNLGTSMECGKCYLKPDPRKIPMAFKKSISFSQTNNQNIFKQVAGAGFRGPLLICLLNLTLNEKSSSHSLQFASKYHVFLNSLQAQFWDHTHCNSGLVAIYYTAVGLEKM